MDNITLQLRDRLERLARLGARMRTAQNDYFRNRGPITLEIAKKAEREFDHIVREEIRQMETKQQGLF